jgi:hypothetical protein
MQIFLRGVVFTEYIYHSTGPACRTSPSRRTGTLQQEEQELVDDVERLRMDDVCSISFLLISHFTRLTVSYSSED